MKIIEINMKHFGRFDHTRMNFNSGMNVICGGNETGKSTIHAFIRDMLYGIPRRTGRGKEEYALRQPWDNPSYFAGTMTVEKDGRRYRIERNFDKNDSSVQVIDVDEGRAVDVDPDGVGEFFCGMSAGVFEDTVYIPQTGARTGTSLANELRNYILNVQESGDGDLDVGEAIDYLKKKKNRLEAEGKRQTELIDQQIAGKRMEQEYVKSEIRRLEETPYAASSEGEISPEDAHGSKEAAGTAEVQGPESALRTEETHGFGTFRTEGAQDPESAFGTENTRQPGEIEHIDEDRYDRSEVEEVYPSHLSQSSLLYLRLSAVLLIAASAFCFAFALMLPEQIFRIVLAVVGAVCLVGAVIMIYHISMEGPVRVRKSRWETDLEKKQDEKKIRDLKKKQEENLEKYPWAVPEEELKKGTSEGPAEKLPGESEKARQGNPVSDRNTSEESEAGGETAAALPQSGETRREEIARKKAQLEKISGEMEQLYAKGDQVRAGMDDGRAIDLAIERIAEISSHIFSEGGTKLRERASQILSELTDGRYTSISLDDQQEIRVNTEEKLLMPEQLSFGTMNQIWLAVRLAAGEVLGDPDMPVILDEPFSMYDDDRLEAAMRFLKGTGRQTIIFSCQTREKDYLKEQGQPQYLS